jgi:hypothetical protein
MLATLPVPRVAMCQMPMKAKNKAIDTIAARKRREVVIEHAPAERRPGERRAP